MGYRGSPILKDGISRAFMALFLLVSSFSPIGGEAEAAKGQQLAFQRRRCIDFNCTSFFNDVVVNRAFLLQQLLHSGGLRYRGLSYGRYGRGLSSSLALRALLLGGRRGLHGFYGGYGRYGGADLLARRLLAADLFRRRFNGADLFVPGNPYPNLGLNIFLRQGEIGFLNPIDYASQTVPYERKPLQNNATRYTPPPQGPVRPNANLDPELHGGNSENAPTERPIADTGAGVTNSTPVQPISSRQRESSETFPSSTGDWHFRAIAEAVRRRGGKSALGRLNSELCNRAYDQSDALARENVGRTQIIPRHIGNTVGAEITAVARTNDGVFAAIEMCIDSWLGSDGHKPHFEKAYSQYCYAVVPVGNTYSCTGVFQ